MPKYEYTTEARHGIPVGVKLTDMMRQYILDGHPIEKIEYLGTKVSAERAARAEANALISRSRREHTERWYGRAYREYLQGNEDEARRWVGHVLKQRPTHAAALELSRKLDPAQDRKK